MPGASQGRPGPRGGRLFRVSIADRALRDLRTSRASVGTELCAQVHADRLLHRLLGRLQRPPRDRHAGSRAGVGSRHGRQILARSFCMDLLSDGAGKPCLGRSGFEKATAMKRGPFWFVFHAMALLIAQAPVEARLHTYVSDVNQYFYTGHESRVSFATHLFHSGNFGGIPYAAGAWKGEEVEGREDPYLSSRFYRNSATGAELYFMVVYGKFESDFHIPEVCYIDDGWSLEKRKYKTIRIGPDDLQVKYTRAEFGGEIHHIYYFFFWKTSARQTSADGAFMFRLSIRQGAAD